MLLFSDQKFGSSQDLNCYRLLATVFVLAIVCCTSANAQMLPWFKDLSVTVLRNPSPGYYFISPNAIDSCAVTDNSGKNMFRSAIGQHSAVSTFGDKWFVSFSASAGGTAFVRRDKNFNVVDSLRPSSPYATDFHEGRIISDTSYIILGTEIVRLDLSKVVPGGLTDAAVVVNVIQERTFSGVTLFTWRSLDHIPVTDAIQQIVLTSPVVDYIHINSVTKDNDGNYLASCRHLDEVIKINRQTGEIMWRLGGSNSRNNQFAFVDDTFNDFVGFSHQHTAIRTSDGTIALFDNGNFKPSPQFSRVVEYEINEELKTAKKVFEYRPTPDIFVPTMGSLEEMENGNFLIGYGSGSTQLLAQEVSRDGVVEAQVENLTTDGFTPYRVHKSTFLMTGVYKRINSIGTINFTKGDSTTHISSVISGLTEATSAVVERHSYGAHSVNFLGNKPCGLLPMRWVFRAKNPSALTGNLVFDVGNVPGIEYPELITLYHRPEEGNGNFTRVSATYNESARRLSTPSIANGEYIVAYAACIAPTLILPKNNSTQVSITPRLEWSASLGQGEYQVEVGTDPAFNVILHRFSTKRLDTILPALPYFTNVFWRVRSRTTSGYGTWSSPFKFTTVLGIPEIEHPKVVKDTSVTFPGQLFEWAAAKGANRYRVQITRVRDARLVIDTIIVGLAFNPGRRLEPNTAHSWTVQALFDTIVGTKSAAEFFVTALAAPKLSDPIFDASDVQIKSVTFMWSKVDGALRYRLTLRVLPDSSVYLVDSAITNTLVVNNLPMATRFVWSVTAVGRYGEGERSSPFTFSTSSTVVLASPSTISPKTIANVDTLNVRFLWTAVPDAERYDIQISSRPNFLRPEITITGLVEPTAFVENLDPGVSYSWRVIGYSSSALGNWSDTAMFSTLARSSQALVPVTPVSGARDVLLAGVFVYTTSTDFTQYQILVDTDSEFGSPDFAFTSSIGSCSYTGLLPHRTYYWKVRGKSTNGDDVDGPISQFTTLGTTSSVDVDRARGYSAKLSNKLLTISLSESADLPQGVSLYSIDGRLVHTSPWPQGAKELFVPLSTVSGMYVLVLHGNSWSVAKVLLSE